MFQRHQIIYPQLINVIDDRQLTIADLEWKEYPLILGSHDASRDLLRHLTSDYTVTIDTPFFNLFHTYKNCNRVNKEL